MTQNDRPEKRCFLDSILDYGAGTDCMSSSSDIIDDDDGDGGGSGTIDQISETGRNLTPSYLPRYQGRLNVFLRVTVSWIEWRNLRVVF
jgi:hypothetical protein